MSEGMRGHDLNAESDVMVHLEVEIMNDDEELITKERNDYDDEAQESQTVNILTHPAAKNSTHVFLSVCCDIKTFFHSL